MHYIYFPNTWVYYFFSKLKILWIIFPYLQYQMLSIFHINFQCAGMNKIKKHTLKNALHFWCPHILCEQQSNTCTVHINCSVLFPVIFENTFSNTTTSQSPLLSNFFFSVTVLLVHHVRYFHIHIYYDFMVYDNGNVYCR